VIVVIPTCRGIDLENLAPLIDAGCRFIVVEDGPGSIRIDHPAFRVYAWPDRRRLLGDREIAIPKGSGACRDLGFYVAWKESEADEIVVALDDDCRVESAEFVPATADNLDRRVRPCVVGPGRYFNIFDLYDDPAIRRHFPRGFPYAARIGYRPWEVGGDVDADVPVHLGLWKGVLDVNAVDRLPSHEVDFPTARLRTGSVVVPNGALISVCSGSMQFRRPVIPAIYQLPMDVPILPDWTINRFGDIWGGFILKKLMDARGDALGVGGPLVHHLHLGPAGVNARKEHLGHLIEDEFVDLLDRACADLRPEGYLEMMARLHERLAPLVSGASPILRTYLEALLPRLAAWIEALAAAG